MMPDAFIPGLGMQEILLLLLLLVALLWGYPRLALEIVVFILSQIFG
jgi:uncharacterized membrane protein